MKTLISNETYFVSAIFCTLNIKLLLKTYKLGLIFFFFRNAGLTKLIQCLIVAYRNFNQPYQPQNQIKINYLILNKKKCDHYSYNFVSIVYFPLDTNYIYLLIFKKYS